MSKFFVIFLPANKKKRKHPEITIFVQNRCDIDMPFLQHLVEEFINIPAADKTVVLPTKRAGLRFINIWIERSEKPAILPEIMTMEALMELISGRYKLPPVELLLTTYRIFREIDPGGNGDFEYFTDWAEPMLEDFNELDMHLADVKAAYRKLEEIYDIRRWDPEHGPSPGSELPDLMYRIYQALNTHLSGGRTGYQGAIYRHAAGRVNSFLDKTEKYFIIAGFPAFNPAEKHVTGEILARNKGRVFLDVHSGSPETAPSFPALPDNKPLSPEIPVHYLPEKSTDTGHITIHAIDGEAALGKYLLRLAENQPGNSAIVLANQKLLPYLLGNTGNMESVNIAMGIPAHLYPLSEFFESVLEYRVQTGASQQNISYDTFRKTLFHPFLSGILPGIKTIYKVFARQNGAPVRLDELEKKLENQPDSFELLKLVFGSNIQEDAGSTLDRMKEIALFLYPKTSEINKVLILKHLEIFRLLNNYIARYAFAGQPGALRKLYKKLLSQTQIRWESNDKARCHIIGFKEAQLLYFDTIILAPVNEGVLPRKTPYTGYFPPDLRRQLRMKDPGAERESDAYHFYQLFRQASRLEFVYNREKESFDAGEMSSFLRGLVWKNPSIKQLSAGTGIQPAKVTLQEIPSTPSLTGKLRALLESGLSPTMIADYIYNPVGFYQKYILKIQEPGELTGNMEMWQTGTLLHETLEQLYKPYVGRIMAEHHYVEMLGKVNSLVTEHYRKLTGREKPSGMDMIPVEVVIRYIRRFLKMEKELVHRGNELIIDSLEREFSTNWTHAPLGIPVRLTGKIDRIDRYNGVWRIIDYKTGFVAASGLSYIPGGNTFEEKSKVVQLMMYALMFSLENGGLPGELKAAIFSFRKFNDGMRYVSVKQSSKTKEKREWLTDEDIKVFESELSDFILSWLDESHVFVEKEQRVFNP